MDRRKKTICREIQKKKLVFYFYNIFPPKGFDCIIWKLVDQSKKLNSHSLHYQRKKDIEKESQPNVQQKWIERKKILEFNPTNIECYIILSQLAESQT